MKNRINKSPPASKRKRDAGGIVHAHVREIGFIPALAREIAESANRAAVSDSQNVFALIILFKELNKRTDS